MSNELKKVNDNILKAIGEQNKKLEHLEEKHKEIIKNELAEYLKDLKLDNLFDNLPEIDLSNDKFVEIEAFEEVKEKINNLEEENKNLKEKIIQLEEKINEDKEIFQKIEEIEEKLQLLEENNKVISDTEISSEQVTQKDNAISKDLEVKKEGKVVNIVINV